MTEQLYRMSWEPLSEADKSAPQVVKHIETGNLRINSQWRTSWGVWAIGNGLYIKNPDQYTFLCLTPVTPE